MKTGFLLTVNGLTQKPFEPFFIPNSVAISFLDNVGASSLSPMLSRFGNQTPTQYSGELRSGFGIIPLSEPLSQAIAIFKRVISEILSFRDLIEILLGLWVVMLLNWQLGIITITLSISVLICPHLNGHQQIILISHSAIVFSIILILILI